MNTGQLISGLAHVGLISVAIFGGAFRAEPLPFQVTEVTAISAEDYAALVAPPEPDALATIATPEAPDAGSADVPTPTQDAAPSSGQPALSDIAPPEEVTEPLIDPQPPQPPEDVAVLVPEAAPDPAPDSVPEPAPRVAPEPVAQPEPDVEIDDVDRQASEADATAETPAPDEPETAREAAASRIVTEAERAEAAAPAQSIRPKPRPAAQPEAEPEPQETQTAEASETSSETGSVDAALTEALGGATEPAAGQDSRAAQGPPLTAGEKDGLRVAVQECWNVGALSSDALSTTVVVAVSMQEDGRPVTNSIEMIDATGGTVASARQAFEAARRAIIRCGARGFDLPVEKYASWRDIEMTFNPERMRIK
ncbi:MAG: energy transducer TonB [Pseudomonadota bacterium]